MLDTKNYKVVEFSWQEKRQDLFDGSTRCPSRCAPRLATSIEASRPKSRNCPARSIIRLQRPGDRTLPRRSRSRHRSHPAAAQQVDRAPTGLMPSTRWPSSRTRPFHRPTIPASSRTTSSAPPTGPKRISANPTSSASAPKASEWHPVITAPRNRGRSRTGHHLLAQLAIHDPASIASGRAAFPQAMFLELTFPREEPVVQIARFLVPQAGNAHAGGALAHVQSERGRSERLDDGQIRRNHLSSRRRRPPAAATCTPFPRASAIRTRAAASASRPSMRRSSPSANVPRSTSRASSPTSPAESTAASSTTPGERTTSCGSARICASASFSTHNIRNAARQKQKAGKASSRTRPAFA